MDAKHTTTATPIVPVDIIYNSAAPKAHHSNCGHIDSDMRIRGAFSVSITVTSRDDVIRDVFSYMINNEETTVEARRSDIDFHSCMNDVPQVDTNA